MTIYIWKTNPWIKKKIYGKKKLGISMKKTHIKYRKETYLGGKKTLMEETHV